MAKTATYSLIASATGTGSSGTLSFTSIPATYTDLILVLNGSLSAGNNVYMRMNNISSASYSQTVISGDGTSAASYRTTAVTSFPYMGYTDATISNMIMHFMDYSNTTTYKTVLHRRNLSSSQVSANVGLWIQTSAINQIDVYSASGATWTTSTTAKLYGIQAGNA